MKTIRERLTELSEPYRAIPVPKSQSTQARDSYNPTELLAKEYNHQTKKLNRQELGATLNFAYILAFCLFLATNGDIGSLSPLLNWGLDQVSSSTGFELTTTQLVSVGRIIVPLGIARMIPNMFGFRGERNRLGRLRQSITKTGTD